MEQLNLKFLSSINNHAPLTCAKIFKPSSIRKAWLRFSIQVHACQKSTIISISAISYTIWRYLYRSLFRRYRYHGKKPSQTRFLCKIMIMKFYDGKITSIQYRRIRHKIWMCKVLTCNISTARVVDIGDATFIRYL